MRRSAVVVIAVVSFVLFTAEVRRRSVRPSPNVVLDMRRSFSVTDQAILDGFSFERVLNAIVERSGTTTTSLQLIRQLFDTQNPKPGLAAASGAHCDDFLVDGKPSFNGFPRHCPTPQGSLATVDPFPATDYIPLGIFNRFDLTPVDGSNCGQYRIIFARRMFGAPNIDRLHFIFEAVLPNPTPSAGVAGCKAVADFWAGLSAIDSVSQRRAQIENFFFTGLPGFEPVFDARHYTLESGGGIRTLQVSSALRVPPSHFFQFRLAKRGDELVAEPDVLENNPMGQLFDARFDTPLGRDFRDELIKNVATLAINDVNLYFMNLPRRFLLAESDPSDLEPLGIPSINFTASLTSAAGQAFSDRIAAELKRINSTLTPRDIVIRSETQGCVICHAGAGQIGAGLRFPNSLEFQQHVDETLTEPGDGGRRFMISPAMQEVFIPHRMDILREFLRSGAAPVHSNGGDTLGGGRRSQ
jgi:hypothetical protein